MVSNNYSSVFTPLSVLPALLGVFGQVLNLKGPNGLTLYRASIIWGTEPSTAFTVT